MARSEPGGPPPTARYSAELIVAARAEALFTSELSADCPQSESTIAAAIRRAVRAHGGTRGCAAEVAAAYGDHPETAAPRMRWARTVVETTYARPGRQPSHSARQPR